MNVRVLERAHEAVARAIGAEAFVNLLKASQGVKVPVPLLLPGKPDTGLMVVDGMVLPRIGGGAGFASYDELISEITAGKKLEALYANTCTTAPVANNWYSMFNVGGVPAAGVWTGGSNYDFQRKGEASGLWHGGNKSPETKHIVYAEGQASAGAPPPVLMLVDLVGFYRTAAPLPTAQTSFTNTTAPDRYVAAGEGGLQIAVVNTIVGGATAWNLTRVEYVDQDGGTGNLIPTTPTITGVVSAAVPSATLGARVVTALVGAGPFLPLAAGDYGVRQLANFQSSGAQQASLAFCLCRPLLWLPLPALNVPAERDMVMQLTRLPRVLDGACLSWLHYFPAATGANIYGQLDFAWS